MFTSGHYITAKQHNYWNHSSIKQLFFPILLLTSSVVINADNVNLTESEPSQEINCTIYRSCTQCTDVSSCSWAIENQICLYSNQSLSENYRVVTKESCPEFAVTLKTKDKHYWIQVTVSNMAVKSVNTFFNDNAVISCEIENIIYNASINNGIISCKWVKEKIISPEKRSWMDINPLSIFYFSIVVDNNVRLQFNDPRDHYISYHSWTCPDVNCSIVFWESDSRKYYCKWCLKKYGCQLTAEPRYSCDVRHVLNNERLWKNDTALSTIEVKSPELAIESFNPDVLLFRRNMAMVVSITIKNHRIFDDSQSITAVTVAGQSCVNPTTVDDQTISCVVSEFDDEMKVPEGPVLVEYTWMTTSRKVRLTSSQKFKFVMPSFTGVNSTCAPATGGIRIELSGEYLNATTDVQVFFQKNEQTKAKCVIYELWRDRIECVTVVNIKEAESSELLIMFDDIIGIIYSEKIVTYVDDPTVLDGQVFAGIASGDVPLIVRGSFDCTDNQQVYVDYNGERQFGRCAVRDINNTSVMYCWPPKFGNPAQVTSLPLGFRVELAEKVVFVQQKTPYCYLLHPDPIYVDFEVYDVNTIRVNGVFPDPLQRRQLDGNYLLEVALLVGGPSDDDDIFCTVTVITDNYAECRSPSGTSFVDVLDIVIVLGGKQATRTVVHRRPKQNDHAMLRLLRPQYIVGGISCLLICVFALMFCVKKITNSSKRHVHRQNITELRNITAGVDESDDYLLDSNT
ncbi:plexin A3-like [Rhopalosiphum padi]|uniref:plexin A3-like n=1 Tax=Rhopalosiphum padi TaxID=40932 RepID=UPI00298DC71B|nr:plexin A3-like [Rhopalosiphum padi]XP_060852439.1 plexin A3-like [Rhopalosiphum padi]XP_060852440.1 plexin A3-like [Rhopalosiphum padi]XP_060852441.1 plexin A3-like [Rhopalosiphum padi]